MIVRDGGASFTRCLRSARPLVDRIVIGDTGSTDDSRAIVESFDAEVVSIPWEDDFAAARNRVLAMAQCDWVLVLDADEMLDPVEATSLLPVLISDESVHAYTLTRRDYVDRLHFDQIACAVEPIPDRFVRFIRGFFVAIRRCAFASACMSRSPAASTVSAFCAQMRR
jgi:glycosyltransferase involved in cell wall biosynthesis